MDIYLHPICSYVLRSIATMYVPAIDLGSSQTIITFYWMSNLSYNQS